MAWIEGNQKRRQHFKNINEEILAKEGFLEEREAKILLYKFLKENPSFACELLTGIKLFPFQHMAIKSMMLTDYFLACWSRGQSKCSEKNSLVWTDKGLKKIIDVEVGDKVQSLNEANLILGKTVNPPEASWKITTQSGFESEGLDYHRVLTLSRDLTFEWKHNKDIEVGDVLVLKKGESLNIPEQDIFKNFKFINDKVNHVQPKELILNQTDILDWYYFFGLLIGDGCILHNGIAVTSCDSETLEFFQQFAKKIGLRCSTTSKSENKAIDIRLYSRQLVSFLSYLGFGKEKAKDKSIPQSLLNNSSANLTALLQGLFDTDGYCSQIRRPKKGTNVLVGFTSTSTVLLDQIQNLCLQQGIVFKRKVCFKGGESNFSGKTYVCNKAWTLICCNQKNVRIFKEKINFRIARKSEKLNGLEAQKLQSEQFSEYIPFVGEWLKNNFSAKKSVKFNGKKLTFRENTSPYWLERFLKYPLLSEEHYNKLNALLREDLFFEKVVETSCGECVTVDIQVEKESCYVSNGIINHNSFTVGLFAILDAIFHQGVHIGIISKSFRQARMIFNKIEDIMRTPKASMFSEAVTRVSKTNDMWVMEIGRSKITALPLGDGEKLRGFRFQRMLIDEFLLMPERIYNEVIVPFLSVVENPTERQEIHNLENQLISEGKMTEDERTQWPNNKIIALSSASYKFEYLYKLYQQYEHLILNPEKSDVAHRVIMHLSYDCAPTQLYDASLIQQAKSMLSQSQFDREFGSIFTDDSSGYFKVSKMAACTIEDGQGQCVEVAGEINDEYVLSFDPSWSESENSDDFGMHVIKLNKEKRIGIVVHSYAMSGTRLKDHIFYFHYLLTSFNIVCIVGDYNGGVQFLNACNESDLFKSNNLKIDCFDADFDNTQNYNEVLKEARNQYNLTAKKICHLRRPTSQWIRCANELLQSSFDHKKIWFACSAVNDDYQRQRGKSIPIEEIKFLRVADADEKNPAAKMIDFIEHQKDMIDLTKAECALIQVSSTSQGTQSFDLPQNLKRQNGADKARRDSYSALVLGNWMVQTYFDMMNFQVDETEATFTPFFV